MTRKLINISIVTLIITAVTLIVTAQNRGPNRPGRGPNQNIVSLQGVVESTDMGIGQRFPSFTLVQANGSKVTIMVGPYYLLLEKNLTINVGDQMTVQAFPSLRFEDTYVAVELKNLTTGATITLRDEDGYPLWGPGYGPGRSGWRSGWPGVGRCYGGPYVNPANIVSLEGTVESVDMGIGQRFPSFPLMKADGSKVTIMAGPYRILLENDFEVRVGDRMSVRAFPSLQLKDTYVAIELKNLTTGETVTLRDEQGLPLWGPGRGPCRRP